MAENILKQKIYEFAIEVEKVSQELISSKKEFILSKQFLRRGTAVGALVREAEFAQSRSDFINQLSIALKEANETAYWLNLLKDTGYMSTSTFGRLISSCKALISMLVTSIKMSKFKI